MTADNSHIPVANMATLLHFLLYNIINNSKYNNTLIYSIFLQQQFITDY